MEKDEAVKLLAKKGYKTVYDHGVPIVLTEGQITKKMYNEIESLLRSSGYTSSFGVKGNQKIEASDIENDEAEVVNESSEAINSDDDISETETEIIEETVEETVEETSGDTDDSYYFDEADTDSEQGESTIYNANMFDEDENGQLTFDSFLNDL